MENVVICNEIVNKAALGAMVFLNINHKKQNKTKKTLGFQGSVGDAVRVAMGSMSASPEEIVEVISSSS